PGGSRSRRGRPTGKTSGSACHAGSSAGGCGCITDRLHAVHGGVDRPHPLHSLSLYLSALQQYCDRQLFPSGHAPKLPVPPGDERPPGSRQSKDPSGNLSLPHCL
ncbi:DUF6442 domain-containing protein, partial [Dysosmobacter welbionis]